MIIYCLTSPSGKHYIGQTTRSRDVRWNEHVYEADRGVHDYPLHRALRKHAPYLWTVRTVWECDSLDMLNIMEEHFVAVMGDYNGKTGGANGLHTPESRAKISASARGNTRRTGHANSAAHRLKQSEAAKAYWADRRGDERKRTRGTA